MKTGCLNCGAAFYAPRHQEQKFCSHACCDKYKTGKPTPGFLTPDSDKALRVRANGLVNKRLKMGWFDKPKLCMKCGKRPAKDSHHTDYSKPDLVHWLCRSCHVSAHHDPGILTDIPPFSCHKRFWPGRIEVAQ